MAEGTSIQSHLDKFNSIIIDLEILDVKIDEEDKAILLVVSLSTSYKHFKEVMLYGNFDTLSDEDVKSNLLSKENFDYNVHSEDNAEGLMVRDRNQDRGSTSKKNKSISKSRGCNSSKTCRYCKKFGHNISECYKLKIKEEKKKQPEKSAKAGVVENDFDGDVLLATSEKRSSIEQILDFGCTNHMCPRRDWFSTYEPIDCGVVLMGNDTQCKVVGVGTIQIKTHDGIVRTLSNVCHFTDLKRNLISLGTLESLGCRYTAEGRVLNVSKYALVLMKSNRSGSLYLARFFCDRFSSYFFIYA